MSPLVEVEGKRPPNPFRRRCPRGCGKPRHPDTPCDRRAVMSSGQYRGGRRVEPRTGRATGPSWANGARNWANGARNWALFSAVSGLASLASGTGWLSWVALGGLSLASLFKLIDLQQRRDKPPPNIHAPKPKRKPRRPGHGPNCQARSAKTCRCPKGRKGRKK